jgi:hypothetical protein
LAKHQHAVVVTVLPVAQSKAIAAHCAVPYSK